MSEHCYHASKQIRMGANEQQLINPLAPTRSQEAPFEWPEPIIPKKLSAEPADDLDYLRMILNSRVYDVANETPLTFASKVFCRQLILSYLKGLIIIFT